MQELRQLEESASVVLVSDGLESCGGDPCEAVKAARQSGVDFRMHVVGFDLGEADPAQLQCMADAGGGRYYTAANAEELTGAVEEAVGVRPGVVLDVTANGERTPVKLWIGKAGTDETVVSEDHYAEPKPIGLPPGDYDIAVKPRKVDGSVRRLQGVTVEAGEVVKKTIELSEAASSNAASSSATLEAEEDAGSSSQQRAKTSVDIPVSSRSRFGGAFDLERLGRKLQGTWVEYFGAPASRNVWRVEGDQFELYERNLETGEIEQKTLKLALFAPCEVRLVVESMQGRSAGQSLKVAIGEEKSYASTAVAVDTDNGAFACTGQSYYVLDGSDCTKWEWSRRDEAWESESAKCRVADGRLVVGDTTLERVGDIYTENPEERYRLKRFDSLDEAKSLME